MKLHPQVRSPRHSKALLLMVLLASTAGYADRQGESAAEAQGHEPPSLSMLRNRLNGQCLIVGENGRRNGPIHLMDCQWGPDRLFEITNNQAAWQLKPSTNGTFTLRNVQNGQCLIVGENGRKNGPVHLMDCQWGPDKTVDVTNDQGRWKLEPSAGGSSSIRNVQSGQCLIVGENGRRSGPVHMIDCKWGPDKTVDVTNDQARWMTSMHWGYADTAGPERWGTLAGNTLCSTGKEQTPIALMTAGARIEEVPRPVFNYLAFPLSMLNNGHTVNFDAGQGSTLTVSGKTYKLLGFHFHTPSEHTLDGVRYPLELHLVHTDDAGRPALVVGIFIKAGAANATLSTAFSNLPRHAGEERKPAGATINPTQLLPTDKAFFKYAGSLTTPPCSEGIEWYVMKNPIEVSEAQLTAYQTLSHLNPSNRPLQPLRSRTVLLRTTP